MLCAIIVTPAGLDTVGVTMVTRQETRKFTLKELLVKEEEIKKP